MVDTRLRKETTYEKAIRTAMIPSRAWNQRSDCGKTIDSNGERRFVDVVKSVKLVIRRGFAHALARVRFLFVSNSPSSSISRHRSFLLLLHAFFATALKIGDTRFLPWHEFGPRSRRFEKKETRLENDFRAVQPDPQTVTILNRFDLTLLSCVQSVSNVIPISASNF